MTHAIAPLSSRARSGVPATMLAQVIRPGARGELGSAFHLERVRVPTPGDHDCLVAVAAAGVNYNNVWAALGEPINVIEQRRRQGDGDDFHIGGSDASGIVCAVGRAVRGIQEGDEVTLHCGVFPEGADEDTLAFSIWGYDVNYGSFAEFTRVQATQVLPKPRQLSWTDAASYMLCGATAYRMLHGFEGNRVRPGDVVLVWGGAGGVGSYAIQLARAAGALPVAVVSSERKAAWCRELGAVGTIQRDDFHHWGKLPDWRDTQAYGAWLDEVRRFGKAIWACVGERRNPRLVIEHPGEQTLPTSSFVCERGGMVVLCGATSGFYASLDLRHHWMFQKRFQGSHFATLRECRAFNDLVRDGVIHPAVGDVFSFEEIPIAHERMKAGRLAPGNAVCGVGEAWTPDPLRPA